jgi:calcineurin-like phosphoesterase family protein
MAERWYVSDHHLWHYNILEYGQRPFANLNEMHDTLLNRHNMLVKPQDHVSFLGDMCILRGGRNQREMFIKEIRKYNGHKRLFLGNHDHWPIQVYLDAGFEKIYATHRTDEGFICSHFPLHPRSLTGATANVHGHIHQHPVYDSVVIKGNEFMDQAVNRRKIQPRIVPYINVSVENIGYAPINLDTILTIIKKVNDESNK